MIKVCHITDELGVGGLEKTLKNIVLGLDKNKYQQQVWCLKRKGIMAQDIEKAGILVKEYHLDGGFSVESILRLKRELDSENFQVIHAHGLYPYCWVGSATMLTKIPLIVMHCQNLYDGVRLRDKLKLRFLAFFTTEIVAVSEAVKYSLVRDVGLGLAKISVIYNGCEEIKINSPEQNELMRLDLGIAEHDFVIGNISRLEEHKGHRYLIEAVSQLEPYIPHLKCLIVGEGQVKAGLERMAMNLGLKERVIFTGLRQDIGNLLSLMQVFVQPSTLREGLPLALAEAASARIPLIATAIGGNPEIVFDGLNGFIVAPNDAKAIAQKLRYLFQHPAEREKMAQENHRIWEERFSLKKMLKDIDLLYERHITGRGESR